MAEPRWGRMQRAWVLLGAQEVMAGGVTEAPDTAATASTSVFTIQGRAARASALPSFKTPLQHPGVVQNGEFGAIQKQRSHPGACSHGQGRESEEGRSIFWSSQETVPWQV